MIENGTIVNDRYEIIGEVGSGGMSNVYKAKDHTLGRYVAVKVLKEEYSADMNFVAKFRTEAQSAAGLEHPNIVNIYDVGSQDGFYYIVMEYVEGITLKTYIDKKRQLNYKETLSIAIQVGRGIQAAHAKNIIHRDIKPQNIIISTDGKVKVTDFGIARAVSENTIHSDVMGSVHYASPEQARNGYVSKRSDIYSLGIVMYEMVTGRIPYDGESAVAVAIKHLQDDMVAPSTYAKDLPISLEKIILKCTQKSPDRRYESMESLLLDLRKSLLSPYEDFVTVAPVNNDHTRVLSQDEVQEIQNQTSKVRTPDVIAPAKPARPEPPKQEEKRSVYEDYGFDEDEGSRYDEYDEDEEEEGGFFNSRMERVVKALRIIVAIIIILIAVYLLGNFFGLFHFSVTDLLKKDNKTNVTEDAETVTMIDLTGKTVDEAEAELQPLGLLLEATESASEEVEAGLIISQDVEQGEAVKAGATINVIVSSGSEEKADATVPDITGMSYESASAALTQAGLVAHRTFQVSEDVAVGNVISQDPAAGTVVKEGDSITVYVSQGLESVSVPDVAGKTEEGARTALGDAGLNVGTVSTAYSDTVASGSVISQSVESGKQVESGTAVDLVVSSGPEPSNYYIKSKVSAPTNVTIISADIALYVTGTDEQIGTWTSVTTFPYTVEKHDISQGDSGYLVITWYYDGGNGSTVTYEQTANVTFLEE